VIDEAAAFRICVRAWRTDPGRRPWLVDDPPEPPVKTLKLALAAWGLLAGSASAHEFWLEPTAFTIRAGTPIGVYVCNGSGYEGWALPRDSRRIEEFVAVGTDGSHPVVGMDGADPAGLVRLTVPGGYVIAYQSNRSMTVQTDQKFDDYLREKGLDEILARRNADGRRTGKVRESYSRYAKALVQVDREATAAIGNPSVPVAAGANARPALVDRAIGLPLEIVADPEQDRRDLNSFRLLYRGTPLTGALVFAMRPGTTDSGITARTDRDGLVRFELRSSGTWRIAAIHMVAPPAGVDADWDSLWASLTFEVPFSPHAARLVRVPRDERCRNQLAAPTLQARR
jgi:uncharacterized GH25 family protein